MLLIALIALMCFGGYTFSKYVTSGSGTGTAQVAKWGYTVDVNTSGIFGEKYKKEAFLLRDYVFANISVSVRAEQVY